MFAVPGWTVPASSLVKDQSPPKRKAKTQSIGKFKKQKRIEDSTVLLAAEEDTSIGVQNDSTVRRLGENLTQSHGRQVERPPSQQHKKGIDAAKGRELGSRSKLPGPTRSTAGVKVAESKQRPRHVEGQVNGKKSLLQDSPQKRRAEVKQHGTHPAAPQSASSPSAALTPLQLKMRNKLTSARFRHLNETLYTTSSQQALNLFTTSPELFADYHNGFAQQVKESWPQNPVNDYIKEIHERLKITEASNGAFPLPRRKTGSCTIADLGCGDAPLARGCQSINKGGKLKFHSYDLHAANSLVTVADISNLPLRDGEADIAVFCLSLMGTNWISFVEEAWRILRGDGRGEVWVSEVKSRFGRVVRGRVVENSVGKQRKPPKTPARRAGNQARDADDGYNEPEQFIGDTRDFAGDHDETDTTDLAPFIRVFTRRGFQLRDGSVDKSNKMFVSMVFIKSGVPTAGKHRGLKWTGKQYERTQDPKPRFLAGSDREADALTPEGEASILKPCVYKSR